MIHELLFRIVCHGIRLQMRILFLRHLRNMVKLFFMTAVLLTYIKTGAECNLVQPGDEEPGILQGVDIFQHQNVYILKNILCEISILCITIGKTVLLLICGGIKLCKSLTITALSLENKFGEIVII